MNREKHVKQNCIFLRADLPNTKSITAYSKCMYDKLECPQSTSQNLIMYKQSYTFPNPGESNIQVVNTLDKLDSLKHVKVNIAITGDAGAGKSSFINKLLG